MKKRDLKSRHDIFKKITVVLMLITLIITLIPQTYVKAAPSKKVNKTFKLKTNEVQIRVDDTYSVSKIFKKPIISKNVSTKGYKVSYKSSDTDVATVSKKGIVKAKSEGDTTITISFKKGNTTYSAKLKVQVLQKKETSTKDLNIEIKDLDEKTKILR